MDNVAVSYRGRLGACISGALFVVAIGWLAKPRPVQAYSYFTTKACTATYFGAWNKKMPDGQLVPFDAADYGTDCTTRGTSYIKPTMFISSPNNDVLYGGTFTVTGTAQYNICFNSANSYSVSVTVTDDLGNSVTKTDPPPPTPPLTAQEIQLQYNRREISYWEYVELMSQAQNGGRGGILANQRIVQPQGLSQGSVFSVGPFGPYTDTARTYTVKITTTISSPWGSFLHEGEMRVGVQSPSPTIPLISVDNPSLQWEVGGSYTVYADSKAYPTATDISLEVRDDTPNSVSHFNVVTSGTSPFPSGASPSEKSLKYPFIYAPPTGGLASLSARACNSVNRVKYCSAWSYPFSKTVIDKPGAPSNLNAFGANSTVLLTWGAPSGGASVATYRVYRALSSGALSVAILDAVNAASSARACTKSSTTPCMVGDRATAATSTDPMQDTEVSNGTAYYYVVRAQSAGGAYSPPSPEATATPGATSKAYNVDVVIDPKELTKGEYNDTLSVSALGTSGDVEIPVDVIVTKRQPPNPNVYGWAWGGGYAKDGGEESDTLGWISLNCTNEGTCETGSATTGGGKNYGVKIEDYTDGPYKGKRAKLSGFAWAGGKEQVAENPTGPNDYQDSTSNGWICFGESCPGTAPGVVEKSGAGVATVEAAGPSDAWINIDTTSAEEWGTVHGWAKVLNLGNDGWVRLGGRSKHSSGAFEQFPLRLSKDPDVSHTDVAGKSYRTFEGHAWGNGRVAPGNADEQDCQSDPQCVNPVGWIDFSCENNSFGVTCAELHGKKIPGINDKQDPTTNKAGWPKCSNNFTNQPYADCFTVGTDYVPPLANLYASNIKLVNVDDPSNPSEFPVQMVTNDKGVSTEVINVVQDQKIQFIARLANIGGSDIPGNKHWDNAFYDLEVNDRVTADATDGHVSIKKVRKSDDTPWNRGEVKEIITDQNDPFTFPSTVLGCARDVYTCRHYIWFKADINNEIPEELSKTDNVIGPVIVNVVANKPDLEIVEMVPLADPLTSLPPTSALDANLSPLSRQYYSDTFTMLVGVKNTGLKPAVMAGLPVAIYRRSKPKSGSLPALALGAADPVATAVLPSNAPELAVGATYYTQITIVAKDLGSPAEYVLTGYVDNRGDTPPGTGFLPEMDETNNQSNTCGRGTAATTPCVFTVAIDPPDLTITSMSVSKTKVKPGGIVKIIAKVKNKGDSALSSTTSTGNVVTGLYMLAPGDTSALPIPITKDDYASKNVGAFTTRFRDLAAGAEIDVEALNDTDPGDATIKGYKMPTAVGTYTFCAFVDVLDTVYEGRLGGERNNGSGSAKFPDCKTVEVQNLPLAVTSCQATYEGNHQAQVRWTAPARSASAPVNGYVIQRWKSQTQSLDVEFARTTDPLAPGLNVARTNYIDNSGTNGPNPFVCQPQPDGYEYRVVSINEVGETSTTCSGVVNCNSLAYLEYNIKSSFPKDLSIRVGRAVHKPDPKGDPAFGDVLPDIDHYEEFNPATGCTYTGDSVDVPSLEGECADKFTPASTTSSTHATGRYSSAGSSINLDRFFGNLSPSFPSNQWYMKVRDNRQQEVVDVPPLDTGLPTIPPKPPVVTPIVSNVSPVLSTTSVNGVKLAPRPTLRMSGGKKFIAYSGNSGLYLQMCTNVDCTTTVSTLIDANEKSWSPPDFQFIGDKIILAYTDRHSTLWLAMCDVATSTDPCPNLQKKYIGYSYGENLALQIDNGKPVIAYGFSNRGDFGDFKLRLLRCGAPTATDPCPDPIEKSFSDR